MPDFDAVASLRGPKLTDLAIHVSDVLALNLAPEEEFEVGKVSMDSFDFVPYALTGLSAAMQTPTTGTRAVTQVQVPIFDDAGGTETVSRSVTLYGPGDVLGLDQGQIVRRYPTPGSTTAEETFHAHIEFDRPELPWAFSAHTPGDRMPAWLALVVLEETEVQWEPAQSGLRPIMSVQADRLPPLATAWAWAHAQAAAGSTSLSARLSTAYAPVNVSRLMGARVLTQNTNYVACLVPTTDTGVRAGLGIAGGTLGPAWTDQSGQVRLPVYDRWQFRTAPDGDFARLAQRLVGIAAPWEIGRRTLDTSRPGRPLPDLAVDEAGRRQVIRCALYSPAPPPPDAPAEDARWTPERVHSLQVALEQPAVIEGAAGVDPLGIPDLPIVAPRIYARAHVGSGTFASPEQGWFAELNLAPAHRVVAGLGTRVVIKDQEQLMQAAWAQVGEVEKANRALALAELARHLAGSVHRRLHQVDPGRLLQLTRPLAGRVKLEGSALTLAGQTARSATAPAALGGAVRRALRVGGPVTARLAASERSNVARLVATEGATWDFARAYVEIDGIRGLSPTAVATLDPGHVAAALNLPEDRALTQLTDASLTISTTASLATAVTTPRLWREPARDVQPGAVVAQRLIAKVRGSLPVGPDSDVVRARWMGGLIAGMADSRVVGTEGLHDVALALDGRVMTALVAMAPALAPVAPAPGVPVHPAVPAVPVRPDVGRPIGRAPLEVARPTGPEILRAGAIGRGAAAPGVAPLGRVPIEGGASPAVPLRTAGVRIGSILRPELPVGGLDVALAAPAGERLDRLRTAQGTALALWLEGAAAVTAVQLRAEVMSLVEDAGALTLARTPARPALTVSRDALMQRLDPARTVVSAMRARLNLGRLDFDVFADSMIRPIMAAPRFDRPMYQALDAYDREWLVPGLGMLAESEMVTLLSTNDQFTEAFLVGLSDEMGRELLWRQYPTDSRGSYFHRFWDPSRDELLKPIHRFGGGRLGSHVSVGPPGQSGRAVVVIRGEIVRRYPDMTVMALRQGTGAGGALRFTPAGNPELPDVPSPANAAPSIFHAMLPPDVMLAGLDITVDALREPGWWIVLAEHPQATRFRRTEADLAGHEVRFGNPSGKANGAAVAASRLAQPVRIAFEADDFLPTT